MLRYLERRRLQDCDRVSVVMFGVEVKDRFVCFSRGKVHSDAPLWGRGYVESLSSPVFKKRMSLAGQWSRVSTMGQGI